jgi:hypothetical protein
MAGESSAMAKKTTDAPKEAATRRRVKAAPARAADASPKPGNGQVTTPTAEEIAEAAYHRYLSRGGRDGADFDDWIEAERDLIERRQG